jgi:probable rRNA maturation factor
MLAALDLHDVEVSILLTDDAAIRALNAQWRQKDEPTDVLSFPQAEPDDDGVVTGLLGDLVVSVDTAVAQAAEQGHDLHTELRVLLAHGLAHLLGHDHHDPDETAAMTAVERRLLGAFGATTGLVERAGDAG